MTRWNWVEDLLLPPAVAVLTSAWVTLLVRWTVRAVPPAYTAPALAPWVLGLLLLAAMLLTRWAQTLDRAEAVGRLAVVAGGLAAVFGVAWVTYSIHSPGEFWRRLVDWGDFVSPVFLGLVACAFMWWQGIVLGRSQTPQEQLERTFYRGIAALALVYAMNQARPLISADEGLTAALTFFATGLGSLALVSVENARRWQSAVTGQWPSLNRYWLSTVAGVIGAILLTGLLVGGLLSPEVFNRIADFLGAVANAVTIAIVAVLGTIVFLTAWLITPLVRLMNGQIENPFANLPQFPRLEEINRQTLNFFEQYPILNTARQGLSLLLIAAAVGVAFWWALRRFARRRVRNQDEVRDSIATRDLLLNQLRALLRRPPRAAKNAGYLALSGPRDDPRLMVRRAYQNLLEWAPSLSLPRRGAGQTPAAYALALGEALPQGRDAILTLTATYMQARYAPEAPTLAEAQAAQGALSQLQSLGAATVARK